MVRGEYHAGDEFDKIQMRSLQLDASDGIQTSRLQLVEYESILLKRILSRAESPNLLWLSWKECPYTYLPSWIQMENLRVLQVSNCSLETLWQQESQVN